MEDVGTLMDFPKALERLLEVDVGQQLCLVLKVFEKYWKKIIKSGLVFWGFVYFLRDMLCVN